MVNHPISSLKDVGSNLTEIVVSLWHCSVISDPDHILYTKIQIFIRMLSFVTLVRNFARKKFAFLSKRNSSSFSKLQNSKKEVFTLEFPTFSIYRLPRPI